MIRNYFKTALRNMRRNGLFTGLNIVGLATGLACSILIFLWVEDELSYDRFTPGAERIFRVVARVKDMDASMVPSAFAEASRREIAAVESATHLYLTRRMMRVGERRFEEKRAFDADSNFLTVFAYPMLRGDRKAALKAPDGAVLTEATAIKYFGDVDAAMGKTIFDETDSAPVLVTGVIKNMPANSHLHFDILFSAANYNSGATTADRWRYFDSYTYLVLRDAGIAGAGTRLRDPDATAHSVEQQLNALRNKAIQNTPAVAATMSLQPLTDIHLHSHFRNDVEGQGSIEYVRLFSLISMFILLIACINFTNLSTAIAGSRAKEVGLRKTIGALRRQLVGQFVGESLLLATLSMTLALGIVALALPYFNELAGKSIRLHWLDAAFLGRMIGITVVTGLLAGSYPALCLSAFNAVQVLKGARIVKGSFLRNGLVVLQFTVAVVMMIGTMIVYRQLQYIRNRDIGFDKNNLLYLYVPELGDRDRNEDALRAAMGRLPQVADLSFSFDLPTDLHTSSPLSWRGMPEGSLTMTNRLTVDEHFVNTYDMHMAAGHFFSHIYKDKDSEYVINETAARMMGLEPATALGKQITLNGHEGAVIGVVKDFNFRDVHERIEPLVLKHGHDGMYLVVRAPAQAMGPVLAAIQNCFQRLYGNVPFTYGFIDQDLEHLYKTEQRMGSLFTIFSTLSIIISCLGLFGLATFATRRRTKEIGVRKVLGAGEAGIVVLLAKEFLQLVAVSLLIAFPIAWWAMHRWLEGFVYKTEISGWVFATAGAMALLVALLTVSYQTIKTAMANPVQSLRSE